MKTCAIAIKKGGQGKTAFTCLLGFDGARRGHRTLVVDFDDQANSSFTLSDYTSDFSASQLFSGDVDGLREYFANRDNDGLTLIRADEHLENLTPDLAEQALANLQASMEVLGEFFDVCFIDTAPNTNVPMLTAALVADFLLCPIEVETYSLEGVKLMAEVIGKLHGQNPGLEFLGMVPNRVDSRKPRHVANLDALRNSDFAELLAPIQIGSRDSIAESLGMKIPVWEIKKTAARVAVKEAKALGQYVFDKMEIAQ